MRLVAIERGLFVHARTIAAAAPSTVSALTRPSSDAPLAAAASWIDVLT